jgi:two-component system, NarL family, invasion response regulator UvrY
MDHLNALLADDHEMILSGFKGLLEPHQIDVVAATRDPAEVLSLYEQHSPDVVVLDVRFGNQETGLVTANGLIKKYPNARVVFYTQFDQMEYIKEAYRIGACAFVTKAQSTQVLADALRNAYAGKVFVPPQVGEMFLRAALFAEPQAHSTQLTETLNERELLVFRLMASGLKTKEIATQLNLSLKTISLASQSVKDKLGVHRPVEMAHLAIQYGLIKPTGQMPS